jgi:hypothetical protein
LLGDSPAGTAEIANTAVASEISKYDKVNVILIERSMIKNAPYNPRTISESAAIGLRKSIQDHGIVEPLIWNSLSGNLVGGHQRLTQLDILEGRPNYRLHVNRVELNEQHEIAMNIVLNNPELQGEYDIPMLVDLVTKDKSILDLTGFKTVDIEVMAFNAGLDTSLIESMFSAEAVAKLNGITLEIDFVINQSDELRKRDGSSKKPQSLLSRGQPQDENDGPGEDDRSHQPSGTAQDLEGDLSRYPEGAHPLESDKSHTHTANGQPLPPGSYDEKYFVDRKKTESESTRAQRERSYFLPLVFPSNAAKQAFCEFIGANPAAAVADGPTVAKLLGVDLPG